MDAPDLDPALLERAYRSLSLVLRLSRTVPQVTRAIDRWLRERSPHAASRPMNGIAAAAKIGAARGSKGGPANAPRPLRVLDVGTGGGDLIVGIGRWAARRGLAVSLLAADRNPRALKRTAEAAHRAGFTTECFAFDAERDAVPGDPDVVVSSLFLHHLSGDGLHQFLAALAQCAPPLIVMNDLRRCRRGFITAKWGVRLVTSNPVVHADAPQSVRAALTPEELETHCARAGLHGVCVHPVYPFRMQLEWRRA